MTCIILGRLETMADEDQWLTENQHGFHKGKSMITALEALTNHMQHGFENQAYTNCVLLDIKGAFDNVWHPPYIIYIMAGSLNKLASYTRNVRLGSTKLELNKLAHKEASSGTSLAPVKPFLVKLKPNHSLVTLSSSKRG